LPERIRSVFPETYCFEFVFLVIGYWILKFVYFQKNYSIKA
jgi:hypothetical protein